MTSHQFKNSFLAVLFFSLLSIAFSSIGPAKEQYHTFSSGEKDAEDADGPNEWFYRQRSFPDKDFDWKTYRSSLAAIQTGINARNNARISSAAGFNGPWQQEGPGNIGGRINVVAVHPYNQDIIYAGNSTGGIFKTVDGGANWVPIFDVQSYLSIGSIVFEPGNPNTIYVGTGDVNISGYVYIGNGIYKSTDAGATWTHLGLDPECIISKIIISPADTNVIYAATMGIPFVHSPDRGLYKSTDGGSTWNNILFVSDSSGIIDLLMDFTDPDVLYAASWNRIRNTQETMTHGPDAKIFKTTNGGTSWTQLGGGLPVGDYSRISLTMLGSDQRVLFASYADSASELYGIYKTVDGGSSWLPIPLNGLSTPFNGQGWYSGGIKVNPANDDEITLCGVDLYKTIDGGFSWNLAAPPWWMYIVHADMHDVKYYSADTIYLTTDGGMYKTTDGGLNWLDIENIPNNQFYHVTYDPNNVGMYAGGVQDNGTTNGNASMLNAWNRILGGDGFKIIYHPSDPSVVYAETQRGGIYSSMDGGFSFNQATFGINSDDQRNWDMPYIMSAADPDILYTGTTMVYKNISGPNAFWQPISGSLVSPSFTNDSLFHTITTLAESPVNTNVLYAGTSDGLVWRSIDGGNNWNDITNTLPSRYVTCIAASQVNSGTAFVSHSGYRANDFTPHIHKTIDNGTTWTDISGDLPQIAINCIMSYHTNDSILFVGTDGGVYGTLNAGVNWVRVGNNMPVIPVFDLQRDPFANRIIAGTFGRSMMTYPLDSILILLSAHDPLAHAVNITLFPNPASESITVNFKRAQKSPVSINVFTVNGELMIASKEITSDSIVVPVSALSPGIYFVRIKGTGINEIKKFVKL